jgi:hypothetical protein
MKVSIDSVQSVSIRNEYLAAHCRHADYLGSFRHPQHLNGADWTLHLYSVCDALVFATNGDPIWQQGDHEGFNSLLDTYGIDLPAILTDNSAS